MTFDTHLSMTTYKMGEYWFSEEVKFQCLRNTSDVAVKLSEWTRDVGVVTRNVGEGKTEARERASARHRTIPEGDGTGSDEDDEGSERLGNSEWLVAFYS